MMKPVDYIALNASLLSIFATNVGICMYFFDQCNRWVKK